MHISKHSFFVKTIALVLVVIMVCPICTHAVEPRASYYLTSYNAYPYSAGLGKIQIWFNVTGVDYMDDIGSLRISIYESTDNSNWTWVKSFTNDDTPSLLAQNEIFYQSHVDYQGVIGRYYRAYICIWAGKDGDGDTRYFWTTSTKATLFAQST